MAEFYTGEELDDKLTDIIWKAKKELIILSPFIRLDEYCKTIFNKLKKNPDLEIILVFGKNEGETHRSLNQGDLDFFKDFENIVIIYCNNLHAKYYSNESEALITSLNLLGKSMTGNVEYGVSFSNTKLNIERLYKESYDETVDVLVNNPCVFVKRPLYIKTNLGFSKKHIKSVILYDETKALYKNNDFEEMFYEDFEEELFEDGNKPSREEYQSSNEKPKRKQSKNKNDFESDSGYCIRTGNRIPYDPKRPFCYEAYQSWAHFQNWDFPEKYCHKTGKFSNGNTSMANPIL